VYSYRSMKFWCLIFAEKNVYRVIQEESGLFCEVITSVIVRKKVHMNNVSGFKWLLR